MDTKTYEVSVRVSEDGEYLETEVYCVDVSPDTREDDCDAIFAALREQTSLYDDYDDAEFEISSVEEL